MRTTSSQRQVQEEEKQERPGQRRLGVHVAGGADRGCGRGCFAGLRFTSHLLKVPGGRSPGSLGNSGLLFLVLGAWPALPLWVMLRAWHNAWHHSRQVASRLYTGEKDAETGQKELKGFFPL